MSIEIEKLTIGELREVAALARGLLRDDPCELPAPGVLANPYPMGPVFIRTVTHHYIGRLIEVHPHELVLEDAAWIADDGRFADMWTDGPKEVEPFPDGRVVVGRGAILDCRAWLCDLPRSQK